jgi:Acetyltransferase (GNAT) domain
VHCYGDTRVEGRNGPSPWAGLAHSLTLTGGLALSVAPGAEQLPRIPEKQRVILLDPEDPRWDAFVLAAPGATVFHHSGWLAALAREHGQHPLKLACEKPDGSLSGVLPLMATRGLPPGIGGAGTGRRLSSLPRTPVAGPLGTSDEVLRILVEAAVARARAAGLRLQLKQAGRRLDGLVPGLQGSPWRFSYVKPLPADPDRLRFGNSRNHARIAWAVRKAQREGLHIRDATTETELREWYRLYLDVNRWHGLPPRPFRFFQAIWDVLRPGGFARLLLAHQQRSGHEHLLAGAMLLMLGDTVSYAFNGRMKAALPLRPNDFLQWQAMRDAAAAGYRWYDFGEVAERNDGLTRFKAKWDTESRTLVRYYAPPLGHDESRYPGLDSQSWPHRLALRAWHRVPLPITAFAGDQVQRFL